MDKEKNTFQVRDLRKRLNRALKKKQELNNRIMKAIEFLKTNANYDENIKQCRDNLFDCECDDLLEILKGEDKE